MYFRYFKIAIIVKHTRNLEISFSNFLIKHTIVHFSLTFAYRNKIKIIYLPNLKKFNYLKNDIM